MKRIKIYCRGGQGGKTAAELIGLAAFYDGKEAQAFSLYGAERRGAPVKSFCRIDDKVIYERGYIEDPDAIIVLDESLLDLPDIDLTTGMDKNDVIIVNTTKKPAELKIATKAKVYTIDAKGISVKHLGRAIYNTTMLGAFAKITGIIKLDKLHKAVKEKLDKLSKDALQKNIDSIDEAYEVIA